MTGLQIFTAVAATVAAVFNLINVAILIRIRRLREERIVRKARIIERIIPRDKRDEDLQKALDEVLGGQR